MEEMLPVQEEDVKSHFSAMFSPEKHTEMLTGYTLASSLTPNTLTSFGSASQEVGGVKPGWNRLTDSENVQLAFC